MTPNRLKKILDILCKYTPDFELSAQHEVIYFGGSTPNDGYADEDNEDVFARYKDDKDPEMSKSDAEALRDLGCFWDFENECWYSFV